MCHEKSRFWDPTGDPQGCKVLRGLCDLGGFGGGGKHIHSLSHLEQDKKSRRDFRNRIW